MGFLAGKRALVVGVAGDRSIAWGIAKAMYREGAEIAYTYQNDKLKERVGKLAAQTQSDILLPCDVGSDEQIEAVFSHLDDYWDGLDIIVHAVAYAPTEEIQGAFVDVTTREGFRLAHDISSYSFTALALRSGFRVLFVLHPGYGDFMNVEMEILQQQLTDALRAKGYCVANIWQPMNALLKDDSLYLYGYRRDLHFTGKGYRLMAETIFDETEKHCPGFWDSE